MDGERQKVITDNEDDKVTPDIDEHYAVNAKDTDATLNPTDAQNKDIVAPFEDLKVDLSEAKYNEYEVWSD